MDSRHNVHRTERRVGLPRRSGRRVLPEGGWLGDGPCPQHDLNCLRESRLLRRNVTIVTVRNETYRGICICLRFAPVTLSKTISIVSQPAREGLSNAQFLNFDRSLYPKPTPIEPAPDLPASSLPQAVLFGLAAALLCSIVYAAFTIATHLEIGYLALGVGYVIGKAMMGDWIGPAHPGGKHYQVAAALLTYLSVSMAAVPEILWSIHRAGGDIRHIPPHALVLLARYGIASPFLRLTHGLGGIIGLFILFIGIRAAWRLTSATTSTAQHPFNVA